MQLQLSRLDEPAKPGVAFPLVQKLLAHITQRQFVHVHRWRPNDLVMWDNRCTLHRGTDFDDMRFVRDMRRVAVSDVANTCEQEGVARTG